MKVVNEAVICDSKTSCSPMSTCCLMINGEYGCCPYDNGNCCGTHCCPQNSKCGMRLGECIENEYQSESNLVVLNWHTVEILAYPTNKFNKKLGDVCPGGDIPCSNGTCCQIETDSSYACCKVYMVIVALMITIVILN